jgi:NAD+ synthase (glutamine-hydrolysing)
MALKTKSLSELGYVKVAAIVPKLKVAEPFYNAQEIIKEAQTAFTKGARVITFPELSITGYTAGDLFHQKILLENSVLALEEINTATKNLDALIFVGLPLIIDSMVFNVAAVLNKGEIVGIVPKTSIPGYKEFYEERWFSSARDLTIREVEILGNKVPVGTDLLFKNTHNPNCIVAAEICEDLWTPLPPSSFYAVAGAKIIVNLSASNELVGKAKYRRELVATQSSRNVCAYVYTSSGVHESTTDVVFGGHAIIAENGSVLSESKRFEREGQIIYADIDLDFLQVDRIKTTSFGESIKSSNIHTFRSVPVEIADSPIDTFTRTILPNVFIPSDLKARAESAEEIINIQVAGLVKRLEQTNLKKVVLGLSGGLDSTLTLLVAKRAFELLNLPTENIHCYTMPGLATSDRTKSNAWKLAHACASSIEEIAINKGVEQHFIDIGHDSKTEDITYENTQARYRTMILMNKANQIGGMVLGTGDLSEIALGWCTFSGDHLSHYNINAGVPKTLVRHLVRHFAQTNGDKNLEDILIDILDTPISPELKTVKDGEIGQVTEDIIGPYELHDFFLYHFVRWGSSPKKILWQATQAFSNYDEATIKKWLSVFITRFFRNQWKRSVMPDGPKVGSIALSPRGDWRMPSDAELNTWIEDLN